MRSIETRLSRCLEIRSPRRPSVRNVSWYSTLRAPGSGRASKMPRDNASSRSPVICSTSAARSMIVSMMPASTSSAVEPQPSGRVARWANIAKAFSSS